MLREFFWGTWRDTCVAWGGLVVVVGTHALWRRSRRSSTSFTSGSTTCSKGGDVDPPSGEYEDAYADYGVEVTKQLRSLR